MPGKKFISKKNAVTYRLVRQPDPDGDTSKHVLVPVDEKKHAKLNIKLPECALPPPVPKISKLKKQIPEKDPQHGLDPDILAALDDDFNQDDATDFLEDNFVAMASGLVDDSQVLNESENDSDGGPLFSDDEDESFGGGKVKPKLTQYSLTSSVTNCTEGIKLLNEKFERLWQTYDDDHVGALDQEEIEGYEHMVALDQEEIEGYLAPGKETARGPEYLLDYKKQSNPYDSYVDKDLKLKTLQCAYVSGNEESDTEEEQVMEQLPRYDCESIISTYSNKHNHPKLIKVEKKEKSGKIPTDPWKSVLTKSNLRRVDKEADTKEDSDDSVSENETIISSCVRPKNETSEEKRLRKQALKQHRRENRIFKKENKLAFKEEKKKRTSATLNANRNRVVHLKC